MRQRCHRASANRRAGHLPSSAWLQTACQAGGTKRQLTHGPAKPHRQGEAGRASGVQSARLPRRKDPPATWPSAQGLNGAKRCFTLSSIHSEPCSSSSSGKGTVSQ